MKQVYPPGVNFHEPIGYIMLHRLLKCSLKCVCSCNINHFLLTESVQTFPRMSEVADLLCLISGLTLPSCLWYNEESSQSLYILNLSSIQNYYEHLQVITGVTFLAELQCAAIMRRLYGFGESNLTQNMVNM